MSENLKLWEILGRTDPKQTKPFKRSGGFKGTAIKPMWSYRRMTEEFGPCGQGWGVGKPVFQVVPAGEEILVYCTTSIWWTSNAGMARIGADGIAETMPLVIHTVYGVGGDKVVTKFDAYTKSDDEAFKKAFTDAITNALKMIGVGADVHMGMFDDNKYVNTMQAEFSETAESVITNSYQNEPPKRVAGVNPKTGERTSNSIRKEEEAQLVRELAECQTVPMLTKLALAWSVKAETEKWPEAWKAWARGLMEARREKILSTPIDDYDELPDDPDPRTSQANNILSGG